MSSALDPGATRGFVTVALHRAQGGHDGDVTAKSRAVPIYQTTSHTIDDTAHAPRLFALEEFGQPLRHISSWIPAFSKRSNSSFQHVENASA